jgi:superfamily II DNA/RNA helicase
MLFYNQKGKGEELSNDLRSLNFSTVFIHGDLSQDQRVLIYQQIKRMKTKIIISTDLLSRGIDLTAVDFVINFDLPNCLVDYEHRVGRTGRFFTKGVAVSFVQKNEKEKYDLFINDSNNVSQVNDEFIIKVKNDFDNMKSVNNRLNDEEIQRIKSLATGIHINQNEVKLLQEKRRRSKYETQSIVHEWENVNTINDNTDKEEQCTLNNTNYTNVSQPQCDNNNTKFCLYCNLLKFLDV